MTDDEKRNQKAMLLLEYQEAEENLAHLREQAMRLSAPFRRVGEWLKDAGENTYCREVPSFIEFDREIRNNIEAHRLSTDFTKALKVMDEIVAAERQLKQLSDRKTSVGLK